MFKFFLAITLNVSVLLHRPVNEDSQSSSMRIDWWHTVKSQVINGRTMYACPKCSNPGLTKGNYCYYTTLLARFCIIKNIEVCYKGHDCSILLCCKH